MAEVSVDGAALVKILESVAVRLEEKE